MLLHGLLEAHAAVEHQEPDPQAEIEVLLQRVPQEIVSSGLVDQPVDPLVELHQGVIVARVDTVQLCHQRFHCGSFAGPRSLGGKPSCVALHLDSDLRDSSQVGDVDIGHKSPPVGDEADQVLVSQPLQSFTDGGSTELQL